MSEWRGGTSVDAWQADVVLPAEGATLAAANPRGTILVAHTGRAHLGLPVDRGLLRDLRRAQTSVLPRGATSAPDPSNRVAEATSIAFRHANSYTLTTSRAGIHLRLQATGDRHKPDVHVELRMNDSLVEQVTAQRDPQGRRGLRLALGWSLILTSVALAMLFLGP